MQWQQESFETFTRRRFFAMAALAGVGTVIPVPKVYAQVATPNGLPCARGAAGSNPRRPLPEPEVLAGPQDEPLAEVGATSHWSSAPRREHIMVHHHGWAGKDGAPACDQCSVDGSHYYDFCVARDGSICNTGTWSWPTGGHAAGCNSQYMGVMLQGCFGGSTCGSSDATQPSYSQLCSLALISLHLQTPAYLSRHQPHRSCACNTECPGTHLWSGCGWNTSGTGLMNQMLTYRDNLARGCNCDGTLCPE